MEKTSWPSGCQVWPCWWDLVNLLSWATERNWLREQLSLGRSLCLNFHQPQIQKREPALVHLGPLREQPPFCDPRSWLLNSDKDPSEKWKSGHHSPWLCGNHESLVSSEVVRASAFGKHTSLLLRTQRNAVHHFLDVFANPDFPFAEPGVWRQFLIV